jgi:hypothetical protein
VGPIAVRRAETRARANARTGALASVIRIISSFVLIVIAFVFVFVCGILIAWSFSLCICLCIICLLCAAAVAMPQLHDCLSRTPVPDRLHVLVRQIYRSAAVAVAGTARVRGDVRQTAVSRSRRIGIRHIKEPINIVFCVCIVFFFTCFIIVVIFVFIFVFIFIRFIVAHVVFVLCLHTPLRAAVPPRPVPAVPGRCHRALSLRRRIESAAVRGARPAGVHTCVRQSAAVRWSRWRYVKCCFE